MNQNFKKFFIYWFFIGLVGLETALIACSIDVTLYPVLYSFLIVFPFVFVSNFLTLLIAYKIPKWAIKYQKQKKKVKAMVIIDYLLVSVISMIPLIIALIVVSNNQETLMRNGNVWPFNFLALICYYFCFIIANTVFMIVTHRPKNKKQKQL